jgi:hypothetical protein
VTDPRFEDLVGDDVQGEERERLRRAHDLLVAAGPPPELPDSLASPPGFPRDPSIPVLPTNIPRRRLAASIVLAAALAAAAFGGGFLIGDRDEGDAFATDFVLAMRGTDAAPEARASLEVGPIDDAGNWPMRVTIRNLPELPDDRRYELFLTKKGKRVASCGRFSVEGKKTVVMLNAPYRFREFDGWVVVDDEDYRTVLRTFGDVRPPDA